MKNDLANEVVGLVAVLVLLVFLVTADIFGPVLTGLGLVIVLIVTGLRMQSIWRHIRNR